MKDKKDLSKSIISEIKAKKISIRSKYAVWAEKLGIGSSLALSVVIAAILFNLVFYWFKITGNLELLTFGSYGLKAFLYSFPYLYILLAIGFFILAALLLKKYDISYKKSYLGLVVLLFVGSLLVSGVFIASGLNERLEQKAIKGKNPFFKSFWGKDIQAKDPNMILGEIIKLEDDIIYIEAKGTKIKIYYDEDTNISNDDQIEEGDWIKAVGKYNEDKKFQVYDIIVLNEETKKKGRQFKQNYLPKHRFR